MSFSREAGIEASGLAAALLLCGIAWQWLCGSAVVLRMAVLTFF